jgi:arylformamidase
MARWPAVFSDRKDWMMDLAAEYNNRALVPDHPAHIARWALEARAYREKAEAELDHAYGARPRNRVDVFHGKARSSAGPVVLFIHGGYWRSLDKSYFSHVAGPANAQGLDVAVAGYTLCPEVTISDIIAELRQCCLYLSERYGRRIVVTGHSAGGHLAACMAATDWALLGARPDLIQAGLSISGLFDLRPLMATPMNDDLRLSAVEAMTASPLFWPVPVPVPFDSWVGGKESFEFLRQARSLPAAWQGLGMESAYVVAEGEDHFTIGDLLSRPSHPMTQRLMELSGR